MCPPNTPYSGGFWASCPLRHPDVSFWVGPTLRRGGARQVGTPLGLLCWGPRPLTSSCCGGTSPLFSNALWWVGAVATGAHGRWEQLCPGG